MTTKPLLPFLRDNLISWSFISKIELSLWSRAKELSGDTQITHIGQGSWVWQAFVPKVAKKCTGRSLPFNTRLQTASGMIDGEGGGRSWWLLWWAKVGYDNNKSMREIGIGAVSQLLLAMSSPRMFAFLRMCCMPKSFLWSSCPLV